MPRGAITEGELENELGMVGVDKKTTLGRQQIGILHRLKVRKGGRRAAEWELSKTMKFGWVRANSLPKVGRSRGFLDNALPKKWISRGFPDNSLPKK